MKLPTLLCALAPALASLPLAQERAQGSVQVAFDALAFGDAPYSGPVFLAFSPGTEPVADMHRWFGAPPVLRWDVADVAPGSTLELAFQEADGQHPAHWGAYDWSATDRWRLQLVARTSPTGRQAGLSEGDITSQVHHVHYAAAPVRFGMRLDQTVREEAFEESERLRLFEHRSALLSDFHGFDYVLRAGVLLPVDHDPERRYPVLWSVTGFGGTHRSIAGWERRATGTFLDQCIVVVPDASNRYGHSVFCNSPSIGPWGDALVHELAPALEAEYGGAGAEQRHVTGGSSGGWSSLWLQVAYPEHFAACWSHVPDPIDFHDFQQINLYEPLEDGSARNMYVDEAGEPRPLARRNGEVMLTYEDFVRREHVLNPGGQIRSFEATFSPLDDSGEPQRVFDVETGAVDHEAAQAWRAFDISHQLLTRWDELEPALDGKIHVWAGEVDTFYLEGAVERFLEHAEPAGLLEHMTVEVVPGLAHSRHEPGYEQMLSEIQQRWESANVDAP